MKVWQGFGSLDRKISSSVLIILFLIILSLLITMIVKIRSINDTFPPRDQLIRQIIVNVTESHLWFEEILSGDTNEDVNAVLTQQKRAADNLLSLIEGSETIIALSQAEQISLASLAHKELDKFNQLSFDRIAESDTSAAGSDIDQLYDKQFKNFIATARKLSTLIAEETAKEFKYFTLLQHFSVVMEIISFSIASIILWHIGRRRDEVVKKLVDLNADQEATIKSRTDLLEETIEEINNTQKRMIEQEKMAALGGMVAGVAHEINTPVGNSYTLSTYFQDLIANIAKKFNDGNITKRDFNQFVDTSTEVSQSINVNLKRASDLVQSFKLISTDQSNYQSREFNVLEYLNEIILSLRNMIKQQHHQIDISCDENLSIVLYPGALAQIFTNLIQNSIIHGYDEGQSGLLSIRVFAHNNGLIEFTYKDNGKGIPANKVEKIFEPFYTTKRGQGGTGLGLSVVYNIVQSLNGDIECRSSENDGFYLNFTLPILPSEQTSVA